MVRVERPSVVIWVFTDAGHTYRLELTNGVLIQHLDPAGGGTDLTVTLTKPQLIGLLTGTGGLDGIATDGDLGVIQRLLAVIEAPTPGFAIVTP